jgi:hypothetical protein
MYKLYFNDEYIMPISTFEEIIERTNDLDDSTSIIYLSLFTQEDDIPSDFNLDIFYKFMQEGSLNSIVIKNDNTIAFHSNAYSKIGRAKWFLDDDTPTGEVTRKVYVYLTH